MIGAYGSEVVQVVCRLLSPFIMLFGLYVIAHGHYGPGGGFAGGVVLAVGVILLRLSLDRDVTYRRFPAWLGTATAVAGVLLFLAAGVAPLLAQGAFLDYAALALGGLEPSRLRYLGILVAEVAVGLAVAGTMLGIFDTLVEGAG